MRKQWRAHAFSLSTPNLDWMKCMRKTTNGEKKKCITPGLFLEKSPQFLDWIHKVITATIFFFFLASSAFSIVRLVCECVLKRIEGIFEIDQQGPKIFWAETQESTVARSYAANRFHSNSPLVNLIWLADNAHVFLGALSPIPPPPPPYQSRSVQCNNCKPHTATCLLITLKFTVSRTRSTLVNDQK